MTNLSSFQRTKLLTTWYLCVKDTILTLIKEICLDFSLGNTTYSFSTIPNEDTINNHLSSDNNMAFRTIHWIPKLHECLFEQRYIAWAAKYKKKTQNSLPLYSRQSNMDLIVPMIKTYFTSGVNRVRILKNLKDLQECLSSGITFMNSIQTFDISILYSILQYDNLIIGSTLSYSPMLLYKPGN